MTDLRAALDASAAARPLRIIRVDSRTGDTPGDFRARLAIPGNGPYLVFVDSFPDLRPGDRLAAVFYQGPGTRPISPRNLFALRVSQVAGNRITLEGVLPDDANALVPITRLRLQLPITPSPKIPGVRWLPPDLPPSTLPRSDPIDPALLASRRNARGDD